MILKPSYKKTKLRCILSRCSMMDAAMPHLKPQLIESSRALELAWAIRRTLQGRHGRIDFRDRLRCNHKLSLPRAVITHAALQRTERRWVFSASAVDVVL